MTERLTQYLLMIYQDEAAWEAQSPAEEASAMSQYDRFTAEVRASGELKGGERLHPSPSATTVRIREGVAVFTDGPFAEAREQLAGFFIIEAVSLDRALALAQTLPAAKRGAIEVRPVVLMR